jgi:hypothetical protein
LIYNLYLILILSGLPFFSAIPVILFPGSEISFLNIFRLSVVVLSIILFLKALLEKNHILRSTELIPLYLFLIFYVFRLIHDLFISPIQLYYDGDDETVRNSMFYILQFFGIIFIPIFGTLSLNLKKINYELVFKIIYTIIYLALLISILDQYQNPDLSSFRSTGSLTLSVLLYGHFGVSLILLSIFKFIRNRRLYVNIILLSGMVLGLISLSVSGSRSPVISLLAGVIFILYSRYSKLKSSLILCLFTIILYFFGIYFAQIINLYFPNILFERLIYAYEFLGITDQARNQYLIDGIREFYQNPLFGNGFLLTNYNSQGSYPHNLIIESFMATGIFGGSLFTYLVLKTLFLTQKFSQLDSSWLCILFIQFFFFGMFSGNLFSSFLFWNLLIIINSMNIRYNYKLLDSK